ncbi:hypothetical protein Efla_004640 [Eimeria flavescens]
MLSREQRLLRGSQRGIKARHPISSDKNKWTPAGLSCERLQPSVELSVKKLQSEAAKVGAALEEAEQVTTLPQGFAALKPALNAFKEWALQLVNAKSVYLLQPLALRSS